MTNAASPGRSLPPRLPRMCVAVIGSSPVELIRNAEAAARDNSFIELRLDYLRQPTAALDRVQDFLDYHPEVVAIATCRRASNGGKFRRPVASQLDVLLKAAARGCHLVDLELQSALKLKGGQFERLRRAAGIVLSFHDFHGTRKLDQVFEKMRPLPADFYKVVTTATRLADNVAMMKFLQEKSAQHSMVGLCMGEQGIISRVLGVRAGSAFTFASAGPGEETAPGQIAARTLRDVYRIEQVDAATRVYGVAGDPVAHSLSPLMMNTAFRRENVNAVYLALHAKTATDLLHCVRDIPIHGLSITMPYKEEIIKHLDNIERVAERIGAVNTVIRAQDGKLYGFNTDVAGVVRPLEARMHLMGAKVLVIGAGGAARAAVYGLREKGAEVFIINRSSGPGQKLARRAKAKFLSRLQARKMAFDIIVNATPVGTNGAGSKQSPLSDKEINCKYLLDMVYTPAETKLMKLARHRGVQVIPGYEMFVHQGARQFEIWTGKPAPNDEMLRVVLAELSARANAKNGKKKKRKNRR
jgi:3-dehydroquinate dehydratase/shikimate dehydrogenase